MVAYALLTARKERLLRETGNRSEIGAQGAASTGAPGSGKLRGHKGKHRKKPMPAAPPPGKGVLPCPACIPGSGLGLVGLPSMAAAKGYDLVLTMPESMSMERRVMLKALGAKLVPTRAVDVGRNTSFARIGLARASHPKRLAWQHGIATGRG